MSSSTAAARPWTFLGMPFNRKIVTGQKQISWTAAFILSLVWFTWGFHIFAGGLALTFTIRHYTEDPRVIAFIQNINVLIMLGPFISYISDQIWSRLGRRLPFILISWVGGCFAMFSFAFLPQVTGVLNAALGTVGIPPVSEFILLIMVITSYTTLYDLSAPLEPLFLECVPPHQRGRFFAIRGVLFKLAVLLFFQVFWAKYDDYLDMFAWLGFENALYLSGEQCIYILAGALFAITGGYMIFNIQETKEEKAPNKKLRELFIGTRTEGAAGAAGKAVAPVDFPDAGSQFFASMASMVLVVFFLDLLYECVYGHGLYWKITHLIMLAPATHALWALFRRKSTAPSSMIILVGMRVLLTIVALAVTMLFMPNEPVLHMVWNLVGSIVVAVVGIPYLLKSRRIKATYKTDVLANLYRIPIVAFMTSYIKDVFFTWSNYPFYIVLVIPGIEQSVWGNFGNIMQTRQFNYPMEQQALWGLPMTLLAMIILTPFSGWYSDTKKAIPFWLRQLSLVFGIVSLGASWWMYKQWGPENIRMLPSIPKLFGVAIAAAVGCLATGVWMVETMLSFVGREHARAWATLLSVIMGLAVNIVLFVGMQLSPNKTLPITLFMLLNVANGSIGSLLETFVGPMIYEYMPRSKMGTINSGRGLMGDGLRWGINNLGGWWIWWYSMRTLYPGQKNVDAETMNYDYTSMYILQFILIVPVIAVQAWFTYRVVKGKLLRWGILEVEGDGIEELPVEQKVAAVEKKGTLHD